MAMKSKILLKFLMITTCFILMISALSLFALDLPPSGSTQGQTVVFVEAYADLLVSLLQVPPIAYTSLGNIFLFFFTLWLFCHKNYDPFGG